MIITLLRAFLALLRSTREPPSRRERDFSSKEREQASNKKWPRSVESAPTGAAARFCLGFRVWGLGFGVWGLGFMPISLTLHVGTP